MLSRLQKMNAVLISLVLLVPFASRAQVASLMSPKVDIQEINLDDLMSTTIESASKREEAVFDSPVSSTVISREEILASGARSISEALRLVPGLIVREQTAGNYDLHIRGLDNVPPNGQFYSFTNTTTLVMINYRPVYNYFQGGTFWETLPIDIIDVDRIEVVRGPVSSLYGPNAVSGVINIITRTPKEAGLSFEGSAQYAPYYDQRVASGGIHYNWDHLKLGVSANYAHMDRTQLSYYAFRTDEWIDNPADLKTTFTGADLPDAEARYPEADLAGKKYGVNAMFSYLPTDYFDLQFSTGYQNSRVQKVYVDIWMTPLTTNDSESFYSDLRTRLYGGTFQLSYLMGSQATPLGVMYVEDNEKKSSYNYNFYTIDANLEYDLRLGNLDLTPNVSYRMSTYTGPLVAQRDSAGKVINDSPSLTSLAASLRADYTFFERLRLIAAIRLDTFWDRTEDNYYQPQYDLDVNTAEPPTPVSSEGQKYNLSFQFASTFRINQINLMRLVYARAFRSPFVINTYHFDDRNPPVVNLGNRSLDFLTTDMVELGYRSQWFKRLDLDLEVFYSYTKNFSDMFFHSGSLKDFRLYFIYDNLDIKAHQIGTTLSLGVSFPRVKARLFGTVQYTRLENHAPNYMHVFDFNYDPYDPNNQFDLRYQGTPLLYGGAYLNYSPLANLNLNLNLYYYTEHTLVRADSVIGLLNEAQYKPAVFTIDPKIIVNVKVSYTLWGYVSPFFNGRNIFNFDQKEFPWSDKASGIYLFGLDFKY